MVLEEILEVAVETEEAALAVVLLEEQLRRLNQHNHPHHHPHPHPHPHHYQHHSRHQYLQKQDKKANLLKMYYKQIFYFKIFVEQLLQGTKINTTTTMSLI